MDFYRIKIQNLEFKAIIGILDFERVKEQKVCVNVEIEYEKKEDFIDYAKVCSLIQKTLEKEKFLLIEDALEKLEMLLKKEYPQISFLKMEIQKPEILNNALVGVEILRKY